MGATNLSNGLSWREEENLEGGVLPGKLRRPGELAPQDRGYSCRDPVCGRCRGWWQALLARGELRPMAGGPDHPPERGPEAEWP